MKYPIITPATSPEITAQNTFELSGSNVKIRNAEPTADRIDAMYVPRLNEPKSDFCVAPSFVETKNVPIIDAIMPIAAISIGTSTPLKPSPAADASAPHEIIEPTYDSYKSAPIPATSPTLSPTLSAMQAGLRGSSSGIPTSTLPTKSAPTSAAFVNIPPPTRANSAIELAPIPNVSIAVITSFMLSLNTNFKRINHTLISKSPKPTTVSPITEPDANAIFKPLLSPSRTPFAVRVLAYVAIFIPTYPDNPEKNPPVKNANGTNGLKNLFAASTVKMKNIIEKNIPTVLYCRLRYAIAPLRILTLMLFIISVPSLFRFTE